MYLLALSYITFVQCVLYKEKREKKDLSKVGPFKRVKFYILFLSLLVILSVLSFSIIPATYQSCFFRPCTQPTPRHNLCRFDRFISNDDLAGKMRMIPQVITRIN